MLCVVLLLVENNSTSKRELRERRHGNQDGPDYPVRLLKRLYGCDLGARKNGIGCIIIRTAELQQIAQSVSLRV